MSRRTNSLTAAAISLGVDPEVLERFLPIIRQVDETQRERHRKHYAEPYTPQPKYKLVFDANFPALPARILNTETSGQCGTPGSGPCTCGE